MNCPYCKTEMEKGRIEIVAGGAGPVFLKRLDWYNEKEFEKQGFFASFKRKAIYIKEPETGYYKVSYHCSSCKKIFGEFDTE